MDWCHKSESGRWRGVVLPKRVRARMTAEPSGLGGMDRGCGQRPKGERIGKLRGTDLGGVGRGGLGVWKGSRCPLGHEQVEVGGDGRWGRGECWAQQHAGSDSRGQFLELRTDVPKEAEALPPTDELDGVGGAHPRPTSRADWSPKAWIPPVNCETNRLCM